MMNLYINRKHFHSINVQIVCDAQMLSGGGVVQRTIHIVSNSIVGNNQPGTVRDGWPLGEKLNSCNCPNIIPREVH